MIWFLVVDYIAGLIGCAAFVYARPFFWIWCIALLALGWRGHISAYASNREWFSEMYEETILTGRTVGVHSPPIRDAWLGGCVVSFAVALVAAGLYWRVDLAGHWGLLAWALVLSVPLGLYFCGSELALAFEYMQVRRGVGVDRVFRSPRAALNARLSAGDSRQKLRSVLDLTHAEVTAIGDEDVPLVARIAMLLGEMVKRSAIPQIVREPGYYVTGESLLAAIQKQPSRALEEVQEDYDDFLQGRFARRIFRKQGENAWNPEQIEADRARGQG